MLQASHHPEGPCTPLLDLASNDYLGLSRDPAVLQAAAAELQRSGLGAGSSRLVSGTRAVHLALEEALATWLERQRVLLFPSGYQANIAAVTALADRHSLVLADRLIHHSLLAGVRASGASLRRFIHNDLRDLEQRLRAARAHDPDQRLLVLVESLYSMEGTSPDLAATARLCQDHGALLIVDEAHALGILGDGGRGLSQALPPDLRAITLLSATFGKAFGSGGAFLAGDSLLGDWLLQHSGAYRYTTALAPPLAAGALAALERIQARPEQGAELIARARRWRDGLEAAGWPRPPGDGPILPLLVGQDADALNLQRRLEQAGLLTVAIRPPTVPEGSARMRLVLRQDLPGGSLQRLLTGLGPQPMPTPDAPTLQVIAMHGWSGEALHWKPWEQAFMARGWPWRSGERGYGDAAPRQPDWGPAGLRVVIAHSLGIHLLSEELLAAAEAVVLLASFGQFVPDGSSGRRLRTALEAMAAQLGDATSARVMLQTFLNEAAFPEAADLLPSGPADGPLGESQRQLLREDLDLLARCDGLPSGFPGGIPVLVVEAGEDRIVVPEARQQLRRDLEHHGCRLHCLQLEGTGHCLLQPGVVGAVLEWLQTLVAP